MTDMERLGIVGVRGSADWDGGGAPSAQAIWANICTFSAAGELRCRRCRPSAQAHWTRPYTVGLAWRKGKPVLQHSGFDSLSDDPCLQSPSREGTTGSLGI